MFLRHFLCSGRCHAVDDFTNRVVGMIGMAMVILTGNHQPANWKLSKSPLVRPRVLVRPRMRRRMVQLSNNHLPWCRMKRPS